MTSTLDYAALVQGALREVVRRALESVAAHGLPGNHHFYITYSTQAPGVRLARSLADQYPEEITIVLQHEYRDLDVDAEGFAVTLRFSGAWQRVVVPFTAVSAFFDPSVQFLLRFDEPEDQVVDSTTEDASAGNTVVSIERSPEEILAAESAEHDEAETGHEAQTVRESGETAEVVSIDTFRRR